MFKYAVVIFAAIACAAAKPGLIGSPWAYTAPAALVAAPAPVVTATSSQVIARNHNGIATTHVIAPVAAPLIAKTIVGAPLAYNAPWVHSSPLAYAAAPIVW